MMECSMILWKVCGSKRPVSAPPPSGKGYICRSAGDGWSAAGNRARPVPPPHSEPHMLVSPRPFLLLSHKPLLKSHYGKLPHSPFEVIITDVEIIWSGCSCQIYFALQLLLSLYSLIVVIICWGKSKIWLKPQWKNPPQYAAMTGDESKRLKRRIWKAQCVSEACQIKPNKTRQARMKRDGLQPLRTSCLVW